MYGNAQKVQQVQLLKLHCIKPHGTAVLCVYVVVAFARLLDAFGVPLTLMAPMCVLQGQHILVKFGEQM